ncbi:MAG: NAD(P)/FAD-dependent oxidoreductase [Terracidiphilus sp.]
MSAESRQFDVIVLGAGAAGLMCAAVAGQRGRRVALLEHNGQPGRKILISGGGRCNFTNLHCGPGNFHSENPHFAKSALALYQPQHFIDLVKKYGIPWHEKTLGQLFCDGSARAILAMLLAECELGGVGIVLNAREIAVQRGGSGGFRISSSRGEFCADALVVATGGLSIPKMGATGLGYELAAQLGLKVIEPRPALVPLVLGGAEAGWAELAGVAAGVTAWAEPNPEEHPSRAKAQAHSAGSIYGLKPVPAKPPKPVRFREKMLVTHRGLSGPAVLQASSYWRPGEALLMDFAPGLTAQADLFEGLKQPGARRDIVALRQALRGVLPQRLANYLAEIGAPEGWSNTALEDCARRLHRWEFHPVGTEGFEKAEVTAGGVDTRELRARTMEALAVPGLYFIGEAVDVTGQLGGYNFQWAWASGVAAGKNV